MTVSAKDKRRQTRYDFPSTIEYVLEPRGDGAAVEVHKGVTVNISMGGFAAYVFDPLPEGQRIAIKTSLPVGCQTATICWTRKEDTNFYLSGLKFM